MGPIRLRDYDAVIGIGGAGAEPQGWGIAGKITWIGIKRTSRYGIVRFENFCSFGNNGPLVRDKLPTLVRRMKKARHRMIQDEDEIDRFVEEVAGNAPASRDYDGSHPCCRSIC
jgi:hypothetical protein